VVKLGPKAEATLVYKNKQTWQPRTHVRAWLILISYLLSLVQPWTLTLPKKLNIHGTHVCKCKGTC
jgi:hypothetical protein